ncbi:hypothetical protein Metvu_1029 [Methanocaldococcus vulcanius M7]|uniref:Uncharacterized protein n=1 Tax=Methanocaldococcus vulcanius (strain ATCC 700851 / DSM 12094 / M7) TaxID=579137 RepID=C9RH35_METVM|nr:hypothetical protein [Methanocaldococcus vulcanius]ACX72887.1 hypothetical protein Metvu_1029 [Methanocaldococcus vulcanius M7]
MTHGSYLMIKLVDENGEELDKISFSKNDVNGALKFAKSVVGFIPKMSFGNKLDILPIATITLTKGLGGVLVWKINRKVYEKEIKPLLKNLKI